MMIIRIITNTLFFHILIREAYSKLGGKYMEIMKVSSTSVPNHVAGAIASLMREKEKIIIQTIGAAALNKEIKAIAISRGYIIPT